MNWAKYLWITGSVVAGSLGCIHLLLTFFSNKFQPQNPQLMEEMKKASPVLSNDLIMWKAWIGFNGSHSMGLIFMAAINLFIAVKFFPIVQKSHFYFLLNMATIAFYVFLAGKYWFSKPLIGVCIVCICYAASYALILIDP